MPFDIGINFRDTAGYVTDGTDETYCTGDTYPTSRGSGTFGWTAALADGRRNRDNTLDRRLAGVNKVANTSPRTFRLDLPASGAHTVYLALGDVSSQTNVYLEIRDSDSTTVLATLDPGGVSTQWYDANGVVRTSTTWPSSQTGRILTFSGTSAYFLFGKATYAQDSTIAHIRVVQNASATSTSLMSMMGVG